MFTYYINLFNKIEVLKMENQGNIKRFYELINLIITNHNQTY